MTAPLFIDVYAGDRPVDWRAYVALGEPWCGAMLKATEGTHYAPAWFGRNWRVLRELAGERYAVDFWRWAYHFLKFNVDGAAQAQFYLKAISLAGGWDFGDGFPVVDVELGHPGDENHARNSNWDASAQRIVDVTSSFAETVKRETGRPVVLYGNGAMRDKGICDRMACDYLWPARYTGELPRFVYERAGWTLDRVLCWQYSGDSDVAKLVGYPDRPPGFDVDVDVSALVIDGGMRFLRERLWAERPWV